MVLQIFSLPSRVTLSGNKLVMRWLWSLAKHLQKMLTNDTYLPITELQRGVPPRLCSLVNLTVVLNTLHAYVSSFT
jgi:hypothetical protein